MRRARLAVVVMIAVALAGLPFASRGADAQNDADPATVIVDSTKK